VNLNKKREKNMNIFTAHTEAQGVGYVEHMIFALRIAFRLLQSVIVFAAHGIFPFVHIRKELDLEATMAFLNEQNDWIEDKKKVNQSALTA